MWKTKKFPITLVQSRNLYYSYTHEIELILIELVRLIGFQLFRYEISHTIDIA